MKLTLELGPGEYPLSREQLVKAVQQFRHEHKPDREPRGMDHAVLQGVIDRSVEYVEFVRRRMVAKLERALQDV